MRLSSACIGGLLAVCIAAPASASGQSSTVEGVVYVRNAPSVGAVIYLIPDSGPPPAPSPEPVVIDQRNLHFVPHILPVAPGQAVAFRNSDPLLHNVFSPGFRGEPFDLGTYPEGEWRIHTFRQPGPHTILCHVHPEMEAYVMVIPTRHYDVADAEGRFRIEDVPRGDYTLHAWHPRAAPAQRIIRNVLNRPLRLEIQLERRGRRPKGTG